MELSIVCVCVWMSGCVNNVLTWWLPLHSQHTHSQDCVHNNVILEQHQYNITAMLTAMMMFYTSMGEIHYKKVYSSKQNG